MGGLIDARVARRIWSGAVLALVVLGAACSESGGGGSSGGGDAGGGGVDSGGGGTDGSSSQDAASSEDAATTDGATDAATDGDAATGPFVLTSTAFAEAGVIPAVHTCNGANDSPPLVWSGAPAGTQSYAVVMRNLSLGAMPNYHWVIYDIPGTEGSLPQHVQAVASPATPAGAKQTFWSFGTDYSYRGPCPPMGFHDYQFTVYSFATATIPVPGGTTTPETADAVIQANKTGSAVLTGKYQQ